MRPAAFALTVILVAVACQTPTVSRPSASPHPGHTTAAADSNGSVTLPGCHRPMIPLGALPPATVAWCGKLGEPTDTSKRGANRWVDDFDSGATHAGLAPAYRLFPSARSRPTTVFRTETFAHNGHWMVDIGGLGPPNGVYEGSALDFELGPNNGGALMRPDAAFRFADGKLVVEFEVAAGIAAYGDRVWPEVVVSTAPAPSGAETNGWYAAGLFGGYPAVGCSMPSDRLAECRVYDDERITANLNAKSAAGAATAFGGAPVVAALDTAWRVCREGDADDRCRDRFRLVFEKDALTVFVNGVKYMEHRELPPAAQLPVDLMNSPVYVYFASWAYLIEPTIARVHWDRIAINPSDHAQPPDAVRIPT